MNLVENYNAATSAAKKSVSFTNEMESILDRGWAISSDLENGIGMDGVIITGLNPSYNETQDKSEICKYSYSDALSDIERAKKYEKYWWVKRQYWIRAKDVFGEPGDIAKNIGFIDLFPICCTSQKDFMLFDIEDRKQILKSYLILETQRAIEDLHPRVIIHSNRTSSFYWGVNQQKPWMGYISESVNMTKEDVPDEIRKLWRPDIDIRIIKDISKDERCIWKGPSQLVDKKSYLVIYKQLGYQYIKHPIEDRKVFERLFHILGV